MLHSGQFIDIVARGIYPKYQKEESKKFRTEKSMLSSLDHTNLVSVIGYSDKYMFTVYKKEANGSLNKYLSDQTLTWMQRLKICLGIANALSYIHYDADRDFSVIHCNIRSSKILLDDKWEPKLSANDDQIDGGKNLEHLKIRLNDIKEATKNFDDTYIIGFGGFGKVYKAELEHFNSSNFTSKEGVDECNLPRKRSTVAIKRIYNQEGEQGFIAEIETLTSCKHENIISLLGFCYEGNGTMILVYEHASKGSLENYLGSSDKMANLNWLQRLNICLDIAHGTYVYLDPEYQNDGKLSKKSDVYSFGVVLLEILTGRLAYDPVRQQWLGKNGEGIAPIARDHYKTRRIMEIVDHKIKEETDEHVFSLSKGLNKESLDIFLEIAFLNVRQKSQAQRGLTHSYHGDNIIAAKRLDKKSDQGDAEVLTELAAAKFMAELDILMEYKHLNVIGLVGYYDEEDEKIIVYEYASKGSLDSLERTISPTWLNVFPTNHKVRYSPIDKVTLAQSRVISDPLHSKAGFLTKESDIFSLGVVLFDILCGKLSSEKLDDEYLYLPFLAKHQ
ncbi:kinase-like domain, phloem protein 2-like protein [Tanacetum coccineum]